MIQFELPRRDQDQLVFHEGLATYAPISCWTFDEADRDFAVEQKLHNLARIAAVQ